MKGQTLDVSVMKHIYASTWEDCMPVTYEISVGEQSIQTISPEAARFVCRELGRLLDAEKGGER